MIRNVPDDVWGSLAALVALGGVTVLPAGSPVRAAVALPVLLFVPGYALSTVLFPRRPRTDAGGFVRHRPTTLNEYLTGAFDGDAPSLGVRLALSVGVSVALVPLLGLLTAAVTAVTLETTALIGGGLVVAAVVAGAVRRLRVPADERYAPSFLEGLATLETRLTGGTRRETALNLVLALSVLAAAVTTGLVFTAPNDGTSYTTAALYGTNAEGELVAGNLTTEVAQGEPVEFVFSLQNHRDRSVDYTVVATLQRTGQNGSVVAERRLDTFERSVGANETWRRPHEVTPSLTGDRVRVVYLVYEGDVAEHPTRANADVVVYHWLTVTNG